MPAVSIEPLIKAVESLLLAQQQPKNEFTRDACIQRFEYTYELAWKLLKRVLKEYHDIDETVIKDIFRKAGELGYIKNVEDWFYFHKSRNLTSHTYDQMVADQTYRASLLFLPAVQDLITKLQKTITNE